MIGIIQTDQKKPLFQLGRIVATPASLEEIRKAGESPGLFLMWHQTGHFGNVCADDWEANLSDIQNGGRVLSSYQTKLGKKFYIITEADRSSTCILLPDEY